MICRLPFQSFRLLSEDMHKRGHRIILTRTQPRIFNTLFGVGSDHFRINPEGSNINVLLEGERLKMYGQQLET